MSRFGHRGALSLLLVLGPMCGQALDSQLSEDTSSGETGELRYVLEWDTDGVEAETTGWSTTNDLGYRVHLRRGYLVSYNAELIACEDESEDSTDGQGSETGSFQALSLLRNLAGSPLAWAGHPSETSPSATPHSMAEDLVAPQEIEFGYLSLPQGVFCSVHYLVARGDFETRGRPAMPDLDGTSIYLEGNYRSPGAAEDIEFVIETSLANGRIDPLVDLDGDSIAFDAQEANLEVIVTRDLAVLLDEFDFDNMESDELEFQLARNVIEATRITVSIG
jgi:hypothetical protein